MSKEIKDYLPFYVGCEIWEEGDNRGELLGFVNFGGIWNIHTNCSSNEPYWSNVSLHKLILRPLSDMSEEEKRELYAMGSQRYEGGILQMLNLNCFDSYQFLYLLSKHFDLFNLIPDGLAIDKTTFKLWKQ